MPLPPQPLAICDTCGTVFQAGNLFGPGLQVELIDVKTGPCPKCGGIGAIPDGLYDFAGDTTNVISTWPRHRLQDFFDALQAAKAAPDPRAAVEEVLQSDPEIGALAKRLLVPRDAGQFWAFVAALVAALGLYLSQQDHSPVVVKPETVIEQVIGQQTVPGSGGPAPAFRKWSKPPPLSPKKHQRARQKAKKQR